MVVDHFTRWADTIPLPNQTAEVCAKALFERVFSVFGLPRVLHGDRGSNFESPIFKELCNLLGVRKTTTSPYHPQGNSRCERMNKTILSGLRSRIESISDQVDWDEHLSEILMAYRVTPHSITKETLNAMMLGREVKLPAFWCLGDILHPEYVSSGYIHNLQERLNGVHSIYRELRNAPLDFDFVSHKPFVLTNMFGYVNKELTKVNHLSCKHDIKGR